MKRLIFTMVCLLSMITTVYAYTNNWDYDAPAGSVAASSIDTHIQNIKTDTMERLNNDHWADNTNSDINSLTACDHRQVTMHNSQAVASGTADTGILHVEDVNSKAEFMYMDEDNDDVQITSGGALYGLGFADVYSTDDIGCVDDLTCGGNFDSTGTATIGGATRITGTFDVTGDTNLIGDLSMSGEMSCVGAIFTNGNNLDEAGIKAWLNFQGSSTVDDSFNVTSVTDNGTGDFTITWATDFGSTNYVVVGTAIATGGGDAFTTVSIKVGTTLATGSCTIVTENDAGTNVDCDPTMIIAIGDQ